MKRVVITGIGALTPIGNDAHTTFTNALRGKMVLIQLHVSIRAI